METKTCVGCPNTIYKSEYCPSKNAWARVKYCSVICRQKATTHKKKK